MSKISLKGLSEHHRHAVFLQAPWQPCHCQSAAPPPDMGQHDFPTVEFRNSVLITVLTSVCNNNIMEAIQGSVHAML